MPWPKENQYVKHRHLLRKKIGKEEEGRIFYSETNSKEQLTSECNENPWMQQNYVII